jgi:hypothetical protein
MRLLRQFKGPSRIPLYMSHSVQSHLRVSPNEYGVQIRRFIPGYEEMLHAWQMEDDYFSLIEELGMLREAGFKQADVLWRRGSIAVIAAMKLP